jgi:UDP-N-acetylmuramoyl-tripeptide--D-alanyl-D-alanine ligase
MLELGTESHALHSELLAKINSYHFDTVLLCGRQFAAAGAFYPCFPDVESLKEFLSTHPLQGFHILIKGSHGIHLEKVIEYL